MKHTYGSAISLFACILAISGCTSSTMKDTFGMNRKSPDEFRVVSRPPLSVPPQFNLRPPGNAEGTAALPSSDKQAQSLVLGRSSSELAPGTASTAVMPVSEGAPRPPASNAEAQFLRNAGADKADPQVRTALANDKASAPADEAPESSWWDIFSSSPQKKDTVVDAKKEAARIEQNKETGQPVTTGDTPNVKTKDTGVLGRIFGY